MPRSPNTKKNNEKRERKKTDTTVTQGSIRHYNSIATPLNNGLQCCDTSQEIINSIATPPEKNYRIATPVKNLIQTVLWVKTQILT